MNTTISKTLYALLFLVFVPLLLGFWAYYTEDMISLPVPDAQESGWAFLGVGFILMMWAMYALKKFGKGLPMNAFPPPEFVQTGPYRLFRHPIYVGFGMLVAGYFLLVQSSSGLWLVTPITVLGIIALVWGYESIDLKQRFPGQSIITVLDIPADNSETTTWRDRIISILWVSLALISSTYVQSLLVHDVEPMFGDPLQLPVEFNDQLLIAGLIYVLSVPFFIRRKRTLRNWALTHLIGISLWTFIMLWFPSYGSQHQTDSFQLLLVPVFLIFLSMKSAFVKSRGLGIAYLLIGIGIAALLLTHNNSMELQAITSLVVYLVAAYYRRLWAVLKRSSEWVANSWKEWVFGPVRVINHGFYVGFGAFLGIFLSGLLVGDDYAWAILLFGIVVIIFSAIWAQVIEGSEKLKRPYGYYGALVGIIFASVAIWAIGFNVWVIIGVISVVMPWVQGIGRFRCLVNGCCHGSKVDNDEIGIRYFHHRSRVCGISNLKGELLHPTPLYAMIWLFFVGFVLLSLWHHDVSPAFLFGVYLILTGIGRFVEEAYRGEVQTPGYRGLRLYQWTAIVSVLVGIGMTMLPVESLTIQPAFGWETLVSALLGGLFTTFAMGVDFPRSNARFSRLV